MTRPMRAGIIGAGNISTAYLNNLVRTPDVTVTSIADLDSPRAAQRAAEYGVSWARTVDDLLTDPDIDLVINLTVPAAHVSVGLHAIIAGKHVYGEKPLGLDTASARTLLESGAAAGLRTATAPDTVLGPGIQTALRMIADGTIGRPLSAVVRFEVSGPESWHPSPEFLFARGGGPLFDMGPYYLTSLVMALGSVIRIHGVGGTSRATRVIGSGPRAGTAFPVEVPTLVAGLLEFESGAIAQVTFSFQSAKSTTGVLEISGEDGTLVLPDPNMFYGTLGLWRSGADAPDLIEIPEPAITRGTGVVELARAIWESRPERCSGALGLHVLEIMEALQSAVQAGGPVDIASRAPDVSPMASDWSPLTSTWATAHRQG